jgi:hypothetical protein
VVVRAFIRWPAADSPPIASNTELGLTLILLGLAVLLGLLPDLLPALIARMLGLG